MSALWRTDDRCPCCGTCLHITDTPLQSLSDLTK